MDTRSAYIRRSRKGSRLNKRLAAAAVLGVAGCASLFAFALGETAPAAPAAPVPALAAAATPTPVVLRTAAPADTAAAPARRVYPYSIVPGGVHDSQELARVMAADKVVAAHYAGFDPAKFTVRTVDKPRAVYVSYRKGDKVYWTSKKLQLAKGETLLSDGTNEIRTRCGNRISDVRMLPVEAKGPSAEELDSFVEQADDDGSVQETGFGTDSNPAGHGYQLHTFENGGVVMPVSGSQPRSTSTFGARGPGFDGFGGGGAGGIPLFLTNNVEKDVPATNGGGSGSGSGSSGSSGPGAGTGSGPGTPGTTETVATPPTEVTGGDKPSGTTPPSATPGKPDQPSGDPAPTVPSTPTTPSTPSTPTIPDALTPPTTDVPGKPGTPGTTPPKSTDVPEPGTPWLGAVGVVALLAARRGKKRG